MKNILLLGLMMCFLPCCRTKRSPSIAESFKQAFEGAWVKSEYIDEVATTKSPYLSQRKSNGFTALTVDPDLINDSSAVVKAMGIILLSDGFLNKALNLRHLK